MYIILYHDIYIYIHMHKMTNIYIIHIYIYIHIPYPPAHAHNMSQSNLGFMGSVGLASDGAVGPGRLQRRMANIANRE